MSEWRPIETLPDEYKTSRKMFVVIGLGVRGGTYNTDPYCVWYEKQKCNCCAKFVRWAHNFLPTHWAPLPKAPEK